MWLLCTACIDVVCYCAPLALVVCIASAVSHTMWRYITLQPTAGRSQSFKSNRHLTCIVHSVMQTGPKRFSSRKFFCWKDYQAFGVKKVRRRVWMFLNHHKFAVKNAVKVRFKVEASVVTGNISYTNIPLWRIHAYPWIEVAPNHLWPKPTLEGSGVGKSERMHSSLGRR